LETLDYLDNLSQRERFTEQGDAITFEAEVPSSTLIYAFSYKDEFICEKACYYYLLARWLQLHPWICASIPYCKDFPECCIFFSHDVDVIMSLSLITFES